MRTAEIRKRWLDYFASQDHEIVPSVSLVSPDPSILFTIAGMVPFIPYILGTEKAPHPRVASVQKCIRTNDIENVGKTTRHGTFFQMNGNFSFGDYFKEGAINFAWELMTSSQDKGGYGLDGDRLWVTIWDQDTEAFDALTKGIGLDPKHIVRLPREENFWDTGQPGPAGPCAEWHYDRGPEFGPDAVGGNVDPGGDRYLEIWNLVFDQYLRGEGRGKDYPLIRELDQKAIDTGAGLERIAFLLQGKNNMYEIDEVFPVISAVQEVTGKTYGANEQDDIRFRVIADHVRSALMVIGDGVRPSNEGRGYVLRRLLRRAVRSVRLLGYDQPALPHLLPVSKEAMKASYPELDLDFDRISDVAYGEEEAFRRTLNSGTTILDTAVKEIKANGSNLLTGEAAFTLHDTYGFPIDLTLEMAAEQGLEVDRDKFKVLMQEQKDRARRDALAKKTGHTDLKAYDDLKAQLDKPVEFLGYTQFTANSRVLGLLQDGVPASAITGPSDIELVLDQTPFYAEAGGQLPDHGQVTFDSGAVVEVVDVQRPVPGLVIHRGRLTEGVLSLGDTGIAQIDLGRRSAIARAHSATHMIHKAVQEELGKDATQAGSENAPSRVRFDFRATKAIPTSLVNTVESRVNERLLENLEVTEEWMSIDKAIASGAMALFGEKYGDMVRVVSMGGDWSRELCAGTHVKSSSEIGLVTLLGEASIGSGVRRVEALVARGAYDFHAKEHALVGQISGLLNARPDDLAERISSLVGKLKETEKQLAALRSEKLLAQVPSLVADAEKVNDILFVNTNIGEADNPDDLRKLVLEIRSRLGQGAASVVSLIAVVKGRPVVLVATNELARERGIRAGALVKVASVALGGGGGGKDDFAQGGGQHVEAISQAGLALREAVASQVNA